VAMLLDDDDDDDDYDDDYDYDDDVHLKIDYYERCHKIHSPPK
jgi:hypothetical protein